MQEYRKQGAVLVKEDFFKPGEAVYFTILPVKPLTVLSSVL